MKKKIAERWVKALRSEKYQQGTGALCTVVAEPSNPKEKTKFYCCLGVLADLAAKSTASDKPGEWVRLPPMKEYFGNTKINDDGKLQQNAYFRDKNHKPAATGDSFKNKKLNSETRNVSVLTVGLLKWAGIQTNSGWLGGKPFEGNDSLIRLNDSGRSFEEIADVIEKEYASL